MALAVGYGEFLIGVSLLIGLLSRVASLFGCALMLAMCLSGGYPGPYAAFWMYWGASLNWSVFAICFAVLAVGQPEEVASVHTALCGMRRQVCRVARGRKERFQQINSVMVTVPGTSINYIFLVDQAAPAKACCPVSFDNRRAALRPYTFVERRPITTRNM
jgi:hypothetical protein